MRSAAIALGILLVLLAAVVAPALPSDHRVWSEVEPGPYAGRPVEAGNFTASDGTLISFAVFRPDVPDGTRVPVVLTVGPYFALTEPPVHVPSPWRLSGFLVANLVSHGYAVAAASVRGTGWSGGCMELMSLREARDVDELVTHLATRPWASGSVALAGKSYDGGVAWAVARLGNPHLAAIVPIAGVTDQADLLVPRGVPQQRVLVTHAVAYWPFGFGVDPGHVNWGRAPQDRVANAACPEVAKGVAAAVVAAGTGDTRLAPVAAAYWRERAFRADAIANFTGAAFVVQGLRDDNVRPDQVIPFVGSLRGPTKLWLGQWGHAYPDEGVEARRDDFARALLAWLDRHVKGLDVDTGPAVEVQEATTLAWRATDRWPDATRPIRWSFRGDFTMGPGEAEPFRVVATSPFGGQYLTNGNAPDDRCAAGADTAGRPDLPDVGVPQWRARLAEPTTISGIVEVEVELEAATPVVVNAKLCADGRLLAQGATSLLHADGGDAPRPYAPGTPIRVRLPLGAVEEALPAGAATSLAVFLDDHSSPVPNSVGAGAIRSGTVELPVRA